MKTPITLILKTLFLSGMLTNSMSYAERVNISLNDETALIEVQPDGNVDIESDSGGITYGLLFNDEDDWMVSGQLLVSGVSDSGLQLSPGVKINVINADEIDSTLNFSLAIGVRASGQLQTSFPLRSYAEFFYAPAITAFNDLETVSELDFGVEHPIGNNSNLFFGYRRINIDVENRHNDIKLDNRLHVGISLIF